MQRLLHYVKSCRQWLHTWARSVSRLLMIHGGTHNDVQSVEDFFAKEVTHLIVMEYDDNLNKENLKAQISQNSAAALLSPIKFKNRCVDFGMPDPITN